MISSKCKVIRSQPVILSAILCTVLMAGAAIASKAVAVGGSPVPDSIYKVSEVTNKKQADHIVDQFRVQLNRLASVGTIDSCSNIIEYSEEASEGKDESFGAICTISSHNNRPLVVMMCNDNFVGKFTLGGSESHTREGISRFIQKNCRPGG